MVNGNGLILAVLRSPVHRLLSELVLELNYSGRRSGRSYVLPVEYARAGRLLVVRPQAPSGSTWWRNFRPAAPVTVRLTGQVHRAVARVVAPGEPDWDQMRRIYQNRRLRAATTVAGPLVVLTLATEDTVQRAKTARARSDRGSDGHPPDRHVDRPAVVRDCSSASHVKPG
jgi:deazaflavin-dependent oxidoreductase (nitroreductase family)